MDSDAPFDEIDIDTVVSMIKKANSSENWEQIISLSDHLLNMTTPTNHNKTDMKEPMVYYLGYSHLVKGIALQKLKLYKESMDCIHQYADLSWLEDGQESKNYIELFRTWAKANALTLEILMGNKEKLPEYLNLLLSNSEEVLPGIVSIIESALVHNYNVDYEIAQLAPYITEYKHHDGPTRINYYLTVHYLLALYFWKNKKFDIAISYTLHLIAVSDKLSNDKYFKKSVAIFDVLKTHASDLQINEYSNALNMILKGEIENEESFDFDSIIGRN